MKDKEDKEVIKNIGTDIKVQIKTLKELTKKALECSINENSLNVTAYNIKNMFFEKTYPANNGKNFRVENIAKSVEILEKIPRKTFGIYYFIINFKQGSTEITDFYKDWDNYTLGYASSFPRENTNKVSQKVKKSKTENFYLLYLGKSEVNLKKRVEDHLCMDRKVSLRTSSLRLEEFYKCYGEKYEINFACIYSPINETNEEIISLLYTLERELRLQFPPLLGNSR